jgi:TfoX/Sxy family transcriptional regulator of competence genes
MTKTDEFLEYVKDLFAEIDGITYRRMFGGCGDRTVLGVLSENLSKTQYSSSTPHDS